MVLSPIFLIFLQHASDCVLLPVSFLNLYIAIFSFKHLILKANVERIVFILENFTFRGPCIVIILTVKANEMHYFSNLF